MSDVQNPAGPPGAAIPTSHDSKDAARYWSKVRENPETGCWEWQAAKSGGGYGYIRWNGCVEEAHRVAYELEHGTISPGLLLRHDCDNPPCVRPSHLAPGTHADNARDASERGRLRSGPGSNQGKLIEADAQVMRWLDEQRGWSRQAIADTFDVSLTTVGDVLAGRTWRNA